MFSDGSLSSDRGPCHCVFIVGSHLRLAVPTSGTISEARLGCGATRGEAANAEAETTLADAVTCAAGGRERLLDLSPLSHFVSLQQEPGQRDSSAHDQPGMARLHAPAPTPLTVAGSVEVPQLRDSDDN